MIDLLFRGRHLVFDSPLSREEVASRLEREVAPPVWQWYENRPQLFEGTFADDRFRMVRLVRGRNSFRPMIEGQLRSGANGAAWIDVRLRLHPAVMLLSVVLLTAGLLLASVAVSEYLSTQQVSPQLLVMGWIGAVLTLFPLILTGEARKAVRLLSRLFEAQPARSPDPASVAHAR